MSILKMLQQSQNGQGLEQLASQLGLDSGAANSLTELLAPALGSAAQKKASSGGLSDLLGQLRGENQASMFDDASTAASPQGQSQGADFLRSIMGGGDAADELAAEASNRSGIDLGVVQQFLPALAAMVQGGLQKNMPDSSIDAIDGADSGGLMGLASDLLGGGNKSEDGLSMLTNLLDADGDGSAMDDILGKFF